MSDLIGKKVYVEVFDNIYGYSASDSGWREGVVVGVFVDGDTLIEYGNDKLVRSSQGDIAFTDEVPPKITVKMEAVQVRSKTTDQPNKAAKRKLGKP